MDSILFLNACARPDSRTRELARHVLGKLGGEVTELKLYEEALPVLDAQGIQQRADAVREEDWDAPLLRYARQFAQADVVVVAAPYWDLLFPAVVRSYFENTTVSGVTFRYTPEGIPQGLCRAKKLIYVTTAGGPIGEYNLGYDYVSALSRLYYGIPETVCFQAEFLDIIGADVSAIMAAAKKTVDEAFAERKDQA